MWKRARGLEFLCKEKTLIADVRYGDVKMKSKRMRLTRQVDCDDRNRESVSE